MNQKTCTHLDVLNNLKPGAGVCEECVKTGTEWVHLRTCQACGVTLCCDSSEGKHARAHYEQTRHAVIASAERNEYWAYCYSDNVYKKFKPK
ncbi:MAG: UBP-type zinc finger domain-containing protein [Reichenbachiella sp.]|uniref:UBP-type zinc finger domain-containing protein n=1 Tax=Reichenbachiella sp. TaxID=2184521 RepID=UPI0032666F98